MDAKDSEDKKQTRGLRRPFGAAGKLPFFPTIFVHQSRIVPFSFQKGCLFWFNQIFSPSDFLAQSWVSFYYAKTKKMLLQKQDMQKV